MADTTKLNGNVPTPAVNDTSEQRADLTSSVFSKRHDLNDARFWLEAIADSSDDAIVGKDLNGTVTAWNKAAEIMFGYSSHEMIRESITRIIPEDRLDEETLILRRISRNEKISHFETKRRRKDGVIIPVSISVSPIRDDGGNLIGISKIVRDYSERDERERQLQVANAQLLSLTQKLTDERNKADQLCVAKSHFLAEISHELRTPLNGIMGHARLLQLEGGLAPAQIARTNSMVTAGKHLLGVIERVLDLTKIEVRYSDLHPVEFAVETLVEACLDLVRPMAAAKHLVLNHVVAPELSPTLFADCTLLRQILLNLLGNAIKFTQQGKVDLRVQSMMAGAGLRFEVADTGPGIPANKTHLLFQSFERLDMKTSQTLEGAGLGLALANQLAKSMGGRIGHADNPGGGSIFWLEVPLDNTPASLPPFASQLSDAHQPAPTRALHILVVDDVLMNRDIAGSFLRMLGHQAICVEGGAQAVTAVATTDFDVVLMDVRMPGMDGLEATCRIRALGGRRGKVPIVALTAQAFTDQVEKCLNSGMNGHLSKPFDTDTLNAALVRATATGPS